VLLGLAFAGAGKYVFSADRRGVVKGILYTMDNSSTVQIDDQLVHIGEVIYGVEVVKINQFDVEFRRKGYTWKQKVRQKPDPAWSYKPGTSGDAPSP